MKTKNFFSIIVIMVLSLISVSASAQKYRSVVPTLNENKELRLAVCTIEIKTIGSADIEANVAVIKINDALVDIQELPSNYKGEKLTATLADDGSYELASFERKGNALIYTSLTSEVVSRVNFVVLVQFKPNGLTDKEVKKLGKALEKNSIFF